MEDPKNYSGTVAINTQSVSKTEGPRFYLKIFKINMTVVLYINFKTFMNLTCYNFYFVLILTHFEMVAKNI